MSDKYLKKADNGFYYVHWTDGRRSHRQSTGAKSFPEAKSFLRHFKAVDALKRRADSKHTVAELWAQYDERHVQRKGIPTNSSTYSWLQLKPHFGGLYPEQITPDVIESYRSQRRKTVSDSTVRTEFTHLLACLNWCADPRRRIIPPESVPAITLPPGGEARQRWLRLDELKRLFDAAAETRNDGRLSRVERFLWLALETAARKSAILELTWDRVDFETGMIDFAKPGRPVTKKRRVTTTMSRSLRPVLERAYAERRNGFVLDNAADIWKQVHAVAKQADLSGVSPNVLRHSAATHMARRGVPLWTIANVLGNSMVMVERVYAKHCPDMMAAAVDKISGGLLDLPDDAQVFARTGSNRAQIAQNATHQTDNTNRFEPITS